MSQSWLNKQRKQTLIDLSAEAGLQQSDSLRKEEIVQNLHDHLQRNATRLSHNSSFEGYFSTRRGTPFKPRESVAPTTSIALDDSEPPKSILKSRVRRATQVKSEDHELPSPITSPSTVLQSLTKVLTPVASTSTSLANILTSSTPVSAYMSGLSANPTTALATTTPAPAPTRRRRSEVPGPASPSAIADAVEQSSAQIRAELSTLYTHSGISARIFAVRDALSSVTGIQMTVLALEVLALQRSLIPFRYLADTPALPAFGLGSTGVYYPDFFVLLSPAYWAATLLWASTSLFVPVLFAYFYNLGLKRVRRGEERVLVGPYAADPVTYNVVKALGTWIVYQQGVTFGVIGEAAAERVERAVLGGSTGILIGSAIGALAALYEATLRKTPA